LYQIETFGTGLGRHSRHRDRHDAPLRPDEEKERVMPFASGSAPVRPSGFIAQLLVASDPDLRKALGRRDLADQRETAYGSALANRPSARPLSFLRLIDKA
jgi:hypothetical protein